MSEEGRTSSLIVFAPTVFMMCRRNCSVKTTRRRDGMVVDYEEEAVE